MIIEPDEENADGDAGQSNTPPTDGPTATDLSLMPSDYVPKDAQPEPPAQGPTDYGDGSCGGFPPSPPPEESEAAP